MPSIIITGASGQLGTTVTTHFLEQGFHIAATVHGSINELDAHPNLAAAQLDLRDEKAVEAFVKSTALKQGSIDAAILLAGGFAAGTLADTGMDTMKNMYDLNFTTAYNTARPVLEQMKKQGKGKIIFIGARPAIQPSAAKNMLAYALSKSLLFRLAECINEEVKGTHITATVIVPSTLDTEANRKSMPDADPTKWVSTRQLAEIMEFVISEKSAALRETILKVYGRS